MLSQSVCVVGFRHLQKVNTGSLLNKVGACYGPPPELPMAQFSRNAFYFVKSLYMPHSSIRVGIYMITFAHLANETVKNCLYHMLVVRN